MVATTSPYGQWGSQQQGFTPIEIDNSPALETSLYQSPEKEVRSKSCRQTALDRSRSLSPHKSPNSHSCRQRASSSKRTSPPTSCGKKQAHERSRTPSPYKSVMTPPHRSRGSASSDESPKPFKTPTTPARTPRQ
ncbi:hypothetical protein EB796_022064 [Bugula neritina]|uniref:Uncharacterized protein n=1 Tax=Bugula neritina TaxID=10212 RepID=A0A7J7J0N4_BUGNE|nr:hypothetical protein EB796_022064 [Bugula neritina]